MSSPAAAQSSPVAFGANGYACLSSQVSVVVPTYNGAAFIGDALRSLFAQTLHPREIIVVDDASTDETANIGVAMARNAPVPVRVIRLRKNSGGPPHPMNVGVAEARSPLVALLDQDDLLAVDRLERQVRALVEYPESGLACGRYDSVDARGVPRAMARDLKGCWVQIPKQHLVRSLYRVSARVAYSALLRFGNITGGASTLCFPRSVWRQVKGFDTGLRIAWDLDFTFRVARRWGILYDSEPLSQVRLHGSNLSSTEDLANLELARVRWKQFRSAHARRTAVDCRSGLSETALHLAYGYREHGQYAQSALAYLAHFCYGSKLRALRGLMRLTWLALRSGLPSAGPGLAGVRKHGQCSSSPSANGTVAGK